MKPFSPVKTAPFFASKKSPELKHLLEMIEWRISNQKKKSHQYFREVLINASIDFVTEKMHSDHDSIILHVHTFFPVLNLIYTDWNF